VEQSRGSWWHALDGEPAPPDVGPVLGEHGRTTGYWVQEVGFVERNVVEQPGFDADVPRAEYEAASWTREGQASVTGTVLR
jgi:hypothetical protein